MGIDSSLLFGELGTTIQGIMAEDGLAAAFAILNGDTNAFVDDVLAHMKSGARSLAEDVKVGFCVSVFFWGGGRTQRCMRVLPVAPPFHLPPPSFLTLEQDEILSTAKTFLRRKMDELGIPHERQEQIENVIRRSLEHFHLTRRNVLSAVLASTVFLVLVMVRPEMRCRPQRSRPDSILVLGLC